MREAVAASEVRRPEERVRELERLLGRKRSRPSKRLWILHCKKTTLLSRSQLAEDTP
jgi:hypothetical protein